MSQSDELDELLFGSSTTPPPSQSTSVPLATKPSNSTSASSPPPPPQHQQTIHTSSSSSSKKENDEDIDVLLGTPSKNQNQPNQPPASSTSNQTKKNSIVTIIETVEEEEEGTVTPKFGDTNNFSSSEEDKKKKEEEPLVPPTTKEQILFTLIYAIAPVATLIVLLVLAYSGTTEGGTCKTQFQGTCAGLATGSGGWSAATIFSQLDSETNLGCPDPTQACVSPDISVRDLYADANYERCWNAPDSIWKTEYMMMSSSSTTSTTAVTSSTTTLLPTTTTTTTTSDPNATTSTSTSSISTTTSTTLVTSSTTSTTSTSTTTPAPSSNSSKLGRIWIVPAINDLTDDNLNVTRALNCCRFLPGGTAGASVTQIIAKAVVGALIDILLNALMGIPIVAKIINVMMFPIDFVSLKIQSLLTMRKAKRKALKETALLERRGSTASLTELENSTTGSEHKENHPEEEDFSKMVQNYAEKAAKDNEQMLQDLNLHSWVDEVCFPSTLMIIKSICLSIFGVYIAANETTKSDYDNSSAWAKYNAYASNIINGAVFSSWLDIGVQFFVFYSTQTDIFRRGVKIAALAPTIGMSYYVKFMFAPEKDHPAYKFFKFCSAARNGTLIIWLCYIAPYVTHICMAFFYYLPMISLYYMTMVQAGGLICCLVAKFFDIYGDNWREELLRKQRVEKAKKESLKKKKKKSSSSDKENDDAALQIATAGSSSTTATNFNNNKEQEEKLLTVASPRTANDAQASSLVSEKKDLVMLKKTGSSNNLTDLSNAADSVPLISASALFWGQIRTFIGRYLLMVMYSVLVFYVYSLCCNWAVLLYDDYDRYGGAKNYVLVVWEELSLRQMGCQILQLQNSIEKGDRLGTANNLFGFF